MRRAVFIDRDGTLCVNVPYASRPAQLRLVPDAVTSVRRLKDAGYVVVVVTNQSAVGRGILTLKTLEIMHDTLKDMLITGEAEIDAIYACPHRPEDGCACRKPRTALFERAANEFSIEFDASFVVGDRKLDIDAGRTLRCRTVLVVSSETLFDGVPEEFGADAIVDSLSAATSWILSYAPRPQAVR